MIPERILWLLSVSLLPEMVLLIGEAPGMSLLEFLSVCPLSYCVPSKADAQLCVYDLQYSDFQAEKGGQQLQHQKL